MPKSFLIDIIAGARPNFMKVAPIIKILESRASIDPVLQYRLIHTGQHYDSKLSGSFFSQLGIPQPDINLKAGSGTQAEQTAAIMTRYEAVLLKTPADLCLVVGDVNSTMACAITAQKSGIPVAHVEAGIRSGDWSMPEEINRLVTDAITNFYFTTSEVANKHLRDSGVEERRIFFVGNTMIDTLLSNMSRLKRPAFWAQNNLLEKNYFVLTLHRPSNVDCGNRLHKVIDAICKATLGRKVVFPIHPRTEQRLRDEFQKPDNLIVVPPLPYLEFNFLVKHGMGVITDSGGVTEEATVLNIPCLTLRDSTERPETVTMGTNELLGTDVTSIGPAVAKVLRGDWKSGLVPEKWDGKAAERIVCHLEEILNS